MIRAQDPGAARYFGKMSKEMADQREECGGKEARRDQIKESDKEEVGCIVGRVRGFFFCLLYTSDAADDC